MKYMHTFYLGNNQAVIAFSDSDNKQVVFSELDKRSRYWITIRGESHKCELSSVKRDPRVKPI